MADTAMVTIETNNNGSGGSAGRSCDAQQQAPSSSSTNSYNLDRDPLSVQIRSITGLLPSRRSVPSVSSSSNTTGSVDVSQNLLQVATVPPRTVEDVPEDDAVASIAADAAPPITKMSTTDPVMEKVASNTMKLASELHEEREREQLRLQAIQQHSPSQEYLRQMQEATKRSQAEEDARIKLEMLNDPQRQESERLDQWLAEESAQIQAKHDLQLEMQKEKEEAEATETGAEAEEKLNKDGGITRDENNDVTKVTSTNSATPAKMTGWVSPPAPTEQDGKSFVVLFSSFGSNLQQKTNQERLRTILSSNGIVPVEVDASKPENKELRNDLFEVSGIRGQFPQIFIEDDDFNYTYIGGFDDIEVLNDSGTLLSVLRDDNDGTENVDANAAVASKNGNTNAHKEHRVYEVDAKEYEENDERRENSDRDIPPSLSSASSSDGWFDDIPDGDDQIRSQSVDDDTDDNNDNDNNDKANPQAKARTRSPIGSIHIVSDHAAGHGESDDKTNNKKKSFLESTIFSPQAGMAAVAVIAGIAVWMSRGSRR